jgi:hypothetical protein
VFPRYGADFLVYDLVELAPMEPIIHSLGVYMGGHPSTQEEREGDIRWTPGLLLGRWTRWLDKEMETEDGIPYRYRQATVIASEVERFFRVQVFMTAPDDAAMDRLQAVADTLHFHGTPRRWHRGLAGFGLLLAAGAGAFLVARKRRAP